MIRSQNLNNAFFTSANDGSLEEILESVGIQNRAATMKQTHSSHIVFADLYKTYESDGIYTDKILLPLVVKTADCIPILMESKTRVSATHAGWRGLEKLIFEKSVEPNLDQPIFITQYPSEVSPLARPNDRDPFFCDRFEFFVGGQEIANGFSELNDPVDQSERFRPVSYTHLTLPTKRIV